MFTKFYYTVLNKNINVIFNKQLTRHVYWPVINEQNCPEDRVPCAALGVATDHDMPCNFIVRKHFLKAGQQWGGIIALQELCKDIVHKNKMLMDMADRE